MLVPMWKNSLRVVFSHEGGCRVLFRNIVDSKAVVDSKALLEGGEAPRPKPGLENNLIFSVFSLIGPNGTWENCGIAHHTRTLIP